LRVLVTRPERQAARTAAAVEKRGHVALIASVLRIEPIPDAELGAPPWAGVLMTSANAAESAAHHVRRAELSALAVFTVGRRSAEAARAAGFSDVRSADGDQHALVRLVTATLAPPCAPLLYLAGEDRAGDLPGMLAAYGLPVRTVVVYRAVAVPQLPPAACTALAEGRIDAVLHFSRRSASAFLNAAARDELLAAALKVTHCCLSEEVAAPLAAAGARILRIAPRPDEAALLDLLSLR
jgi:uroporphyrinogen-III synthase